MTDGNGHGRLRGPRATGAPRPDEAAGPQPIAPWKLPLLVALLIVPVIGGVALGGLALGFGLAAAIALVLVLLAGRRRRDEPLQLAEPGEEGAGTVVVLMDEVDPRGSRALADAVGEDGIFLVAPAIGSDLRKWVTTPNAAQREASGRLDAAKAALRGARRDGRRIEGLVGDPDPVTSVEDALRIYPAREVVFAVSPEGEEEVPLEELRERTEVPLRTVTL